MYDQSFCRKTLEREIRKSDFRRIPAKDQAAFKEKLLTLALNAANSYFLPPPHIGTANLLTAFPLEGKTVFGFAKLSDEIVARKLRTNIKRATKVLTRGRSQIVANLQLLLEEGIPYKVYRFDVKSFYESFNRENVLKAVNELPKLSPHSKTLVAAILRNHELIGGYGLPRGLALSAVLSDWLMQEFDSMVAGHDDVFFYSRFVDDIIVLTSAREDSVLFSTWIERILPNGLTLNAIKSDVFSADKRVSPAKAPAIPPHILQFDYLGYSFSVNEPPLNTKVKSGAHARHVVADVASGKIRKLKKRIVRSFLDYATTSNWSLLIDRIKFLTQNFSVYNPKVGGKKLAGIYHSYPQVSQDAKGLKELDRFLRNSILSKTGRVSSMTSAVLNAQQKRQLLSQSFVRGHNKKTFVHFSAARISQIQKCWLN
ncbi:antiviral reverse transcriptase Drt3a [Herbaspirillum sp. GCM10030257]|uniref:antiviral reverse transcriptase Drt3a n=1 Tax=Herbaspirillum sp. GCM10030257 TaxID=3273393 RepID=UPI00360E5D7B